MLIALGSLVAVWACAAREGATTEMKARQSTTTLMFVVAPSRQRGNMIVLFAGLTLIKNGCHCVDIVIERLQDELCGPAEIQDLFQAVPNSEKKLTG
jgi:hypothetical protein